MVSARRGSIQNIEIGSDGKSVPRPVVPAGQGYERKNEKSIPKWKHFHFRFIIDVLARIF